MNFKLRWRWYRIWLWIVDHWKFQVTREIRITSFPEYQFPFRLSENWLHRVYRLGIPFLERNIFLNLWKINRAYSLIVYFEFFGWVTILLTFFFTDDNEDGFFTKDVFISYSGKDYDWVKEHLMPLLDHNQIDYIIHSRDFEPGKAWIENMADSVYNSRKVMLIMSANYLASGFCKDEMYMATHRESARNDASLIVVRIDPNIKTADLPKILRHRTFIDVTSQEEVTTWKGRILEYVRSDSRPVPLPRSATESVTSNESMQFSETRTLLSIFKLKKKKRVQKNLSNVIWTRAFSSSLMMTLIHVIVWQSFVASLG